MYNFGYFNEDNFSHLYHTLYGMLAFVSLLFVLKVDLKRRHIPIKLMKYISITLIVVFSIIVGFRTVEVGTDTGIYYYQWIADIPYESITEIVFYFLMKFIKSFDLSFSVFLIIVSSLYYFFTFKAFENLSKKYDTSIILLLLSFISLFFSNSMAINIIRQGLSMSILLYAYSLFINKDRKYWIFTLIGFLTHSTSIISILIFIGINKFARKVSIYYFIFLFFIGILLSFLNFGLLDVAPFIIDILGADSRRTTYITNGSSDYVVGFKPQFVVFNTIFLLFFLKARKKLLNHKWGENYQVLLKYFLLTSFLFFMAFQLPYSDRWGIFSWISIPVLMLPYFSRGISVVRFKTPIVLFFIFIYIFFAIYNSSK
ncbi:EpsG family protein [Riemerella anatipestifer]|uniref:EpsG family protein n=3 Tax=Riemerella anatipestifer TaxID=34085 RepID=A0A1S7DR56_RIEAN|nr:EpsG family protein [Riemerella anatipestifer]AQY21604.1 hypothetical protein AB406_0646 [Riemerella anatipestifer]MDD1552694.1 EpsG family protein [Riemerella anatipestifer]MDD1595315.1 EpsG family protein [Riemerella anatipestifer]MDY3379829.1 EpsG family protein [Riemerella anatipestifer]MDY3383557.1 EpsG family protein [Riemerella anatipestifer]